MKKVFNSFLAVMIVLAMASAARAELAVVTASIGTDDVYELNTLTPGATKTFLGTRLRGPLQAGVDNSAANEFGLGPEAYTASTAVLLKVTGSNHGESVTLANGYQNQEFTIVLETDGGTTFTVSPSTKSGFTSVGLSDAKDSVTLKYIDSTEGWIITGNNGATIN